MDQRHKQFLKLLDDCGDRLYALLYRLTLRDDIAEDIMQELFIKLNNLKDFEKIKNLRAYTWRVAINLACDWRQQQAHKTISLNCVPDTRSPEDGPAEKVFKKEQAEGLLIAIASLKDMFREVIVLRYLEEASYEEIGHRIGKKPHYARTICHRARQQLLTILSSDDCDGRSFRSEVCNG